MTARSPAANVPTREADCVLPSAVVTAMVDAPEMTWLLVTTSPLSLTTTPEPRPRLVWICTIEGRTRSTTATNAFCRSVAGELGAVPEDDFGVGEPGGEVAGWPVHPANTSAMSIAPKPEPNFNAPRRCMRRPAQRAAQLHRPGPGEEPPRLCGLANPCHSNFSRSAVVELAAQPSSHHL